MRSWILNLSASVLNAISWTVRRCLWLPGCTYTFALFCLLQTVLHVRTDWTEGAAWFCAALISIQWGSDLRELERQEAINQQLLSSLKLATIGRHRKLK